MKCSHLLAQSSLNKELTKDFEVSALVQDHRQAQKGSVFFAIQGLKFDGHEVAESAVRAGAQLIVSQRPVELSNGALIDNIVVDDIRSTLSELASLFYGEPSKYFKTVGITGTNGKTSVSLLLESILTSQKNKVGVIGTIDHHLGHKVWSTDLTTSSPLQLQERLRDFKKLGASHACLEVSSHALDQKRVDHVHFDVGVFTNLSRDHLDYHKTFDDYFEAKARLFKDLLSRNNGISVINIDDECGNKLIGLDNVVSFGQAVEADFSFKEVVPSFEGTQFTLVYQQKSYLIKTPLIGLHNVYNVVSAIAVCKSLGLAIEDSIQALAHFKDIPGRLERVSNNQGKHIFVDYAHTDDALRSALSALKQVRASSAQPESRIFVVFGCGGDRDPGKRSLMARAAEDLADTVIVTSDNPRTEDPQAIIDDVFLGFKDPKSIIRQVHRKEAIEEALKRAQKNDVVLIAGKGHEDYQILGTEKIHFSDVEVAKAFFDAIGNN